VRLLWYLDNTPRTWLKRSNQVVQVWKYLTRTFAQLRAFCGNLFRELLDPMETKGGTILWGFLLFLSYVIGCCFYIASQEQGWNNPNLPAPAFWKLGSKSSPCMSPHHCFQTMIQLGTYDGDGFDFLVNLTNSGLVVLPLLALLHLSISGLVLLNGLIVIFGNVFDLPETIDTDAPKDEEVTLEVLTKKWEELREVLKSSRRTLGQSLVLNSHGPAQSSPVKLGWH